MDVDVDYLCVDQDLGSPDQSSNRYRWRRQQIKNREQPNGERFFFWAKECAFNPCLDVQNPNQPTPPDSSVTYKYHLTPQPGTFISSSSTTESTSIIHRRFHHQNHQNNHIPSHPQWPAPSKREFHPMQHLLFHFLTFARF